MASYDYVQLLVYLVLLYLLWRLLKLFHFYFREYYVLWQIAMGGTRSDGHGKAMSPKIRLYVYICETVLLDEVSVNELYGFLMKMIDSDFSIKEFHHSVLLNYKYAIICRERRDGSLRGMMLLGVDRKELDGVKYTQVKVGLSFFQNYYRGGPWLYFASAYLILKEMILHPFTPLYMIGKAFSYKSYLVMCHYVQESFPRYDRETPAFAKKLLNNFGLSTKSPNEIYDPETFVLKRERSGMKPGVAVLTENDLKDPHIKFFVERNPGWAKGHQMLAMGRMRWVDLLRMIWRTVNRAVRARKEKGGRPHRKPTLSRRYSFQSEELANRYATVPSKLDIGGNHHHVMTGIPEEGETADRKSVV